MSHTPAESRTPALPAAPGSADTRLLRDTFRPEGNHGSLRWFCAEVFRSADLRRELPGLAVAALIYNVLGLAMALAMLQIMDRVVVNQAHETLFFLAFGAMAAMAIEELMRALNGAVTGWVGARFEHCMTMAALAHLMRVPLRRLQAEEPGVHVERIAAVAKVAEFYSGEALLVLFDLPFAPLFLIAIALIGGWVVLVPVAILVVFTLVGARFAHWMRHNIDQHHLVEDRRIGFLIEVLSGIHSVKTMMMEAQMLRRYERLQSSNVNVGEALSYGNAMTASTGMVFAQIMTVGTIFISSIAVLGGHMTPGGLAACMTLAVRALQPLRRALVVWLRYQAILAARLRVQEIADLPVDDAAGASTMPPLSRDLVLEGVTIATSAGTPLLADVFLRIPAGRCIAIEGRSGSGKTTVMQLLAGLVAPARGRVLADSEDLAGFEPDSLHRQIALLGQTGSVVAGTLLENLTMFDPALEANAIATAQAVGLDRIVADMKLGYATPLGKGNAETLALGTRQLISIVRALTCNPSVILFDEANTSLDITSDRQLCAFLAELKTRATLVIVSHRPSLLALADQVYHIANGQLHTGRAPGTEGQQTLAVPSIAAERPCPDTADGSQLIAAHFGQPSDLSRCLWPLLQALRWQGSARELAEVLPHAEAALDLSGLCNLLPHLGFQPQFLRTAPAALDHRLMPCLFLPNNQPAMVVHARLPDGRLQVTQAEDMQDASTPSGHLPPRREIDAPTTPGEILCFKAVTFPPRESGTANSWFDRLGQRFQRHALLAFLLTLASTVLGLTAPLFVRAIYDHVLPTGDLSAGTMLLVGVGIALLLDVHLRRLKSRLMAHVGGRLEFILGISAFRSVIGLPLHQVENTPVNRQVARLRSFESLREFFLGPLTIIAFELPANLAIVVAIAILNPWALAVIVTSTLLYGLLYLATRGPVARAVTNQSQAAQGRWEFLNETMTQMPLVRASGRGNTWLDRFRDLSGKAVYTAYRQHQLHARITGAAQTLSKLTGLAALTVSTLICIEGGISTGTLVATTMLVWRLTGPLQNVFVAMTSLTRIRSSMRQIETLMKLPPESDTGMTQVVRKATTPSTLVFSRVSFRYAADSDPSLLGVQFSIQPGHVAVIAGNNGSGKSTLFKLIARAYLPQAGTILLDNLDIRQMAISELRARIAYMPQSHDIFHGTVAQNLRLVAPTASDAEVAWAMDMAGLSADVRALPEGLQTRISGSRSEKLPNGFRQRLALARVMLKPAALVLLDEPGTGLDDAGSQALERCVAWLRGRSTVLMISHRPSHMRLADTVVLMNRGSVVAAGAFDQVKERITSGISQ